MSLSEENVKYSLKNLIQKPSRSILTIVSILFGITTIFIFISFGMGLYNYINQFAAESSADKVTIMPKGVGAPGMDDTFALTEDDIRAIEQTSGVHKVSAIYVKVAEIKQRETVKYAFLMGMDLEEKMLFEMSNIGIYKGSWLKTGEDRKVLLGYNYMIKDRIFSRGFDVNDKIEIQGEDFRVAGFFESIGNPQDDSQMYITEAAMKDLYGDSLKGYNMAIAQVDADNLDSIVNRIERSLRASRNVEKGKEDFFVQSWQDMMETYSNVLNGAIGFIMLIAFISVVVSAINTTNTMITSVLERTREIGVMKAVGAENKEIFKIFLLESAVLGGIAGIIGVGLGWLLTKLASISLKSAGWGFLTPYYSLSLFLALIAFAALTGAISGAVPAYRASKINPVQALRYE